MPEEYVYFTQGKGFAPSTHPGDMDRETPILEVFVNAMAVFQQWDHLKVSPSQKG